VDALRQGDVSSVFFARFVTINVKLNNLLLT